MSRSSERTLPYNVKVVEKASTIDGKQTEWRIHGVKGLILVCEKSGSARYIFRYVAMVGNKRVFRKIKIGQRSALALSDARRKAEDFARAIERDGADPVAEARATRKSQTFAELVDAFEAKRGPELSPSVIIDYVRCLRKDVLPTIGSMAAHQITRDQIADIIGAIAARGSLVMADRTRAAIGSVFSWGLKSRTMKGLGMNPASGVAKNASNEGRNRSITEDELRAVWQGIDAAPAMIHQKTGIIIEGRFHEGLSEPVRLCIRLCWLTGSRRSEVVGAKVSEFNFPAKLWVIPGAKLAKGRLTGGRTKNKQTKIVPLSNTAIALFHRAFELAGASDHVFPSHPGCKLPHIEPHSLTTAIQRITDRLGIDDLRLHDGRSACRTWMRDQGIDASVRDAVLGHVGRSVGERHYEAQSMVFIEKRVRPALEAWDAYVMATVGNGTQGAITPASIGCEHEKRARFYRYKPATRSRAVNRAPLPIVDGDEPAITSVAKEF